MQITSLKEKLKQCFNSQANFSWIIRSWG